MGGNGITYEDASATRQVKRLCTESGSHQADVGINGFSEIKQEEGRGLADPATASLSKKFPDVPFRRPRPQQTAARLLEADRLSVFLRRLWSSEVSSSLPEVNEEIPRDPVPEPSLSPSLIQSIGEHYGILAPSKLSGMKLTPQAASTLAATLEYRLRIVIQVAKRFCRTSVASNARGGVLTLSNVLAALNNLKISLDEPNAWKLPAFLSLGLNASASALGRIPLPTAQALSAFPLDIISRVVEITQTDTSPDPIVDTKTFARQQPTPDACELPKLVLHWVVVDGHLISNPLNASCFSGKQDDEEEAFLRQYNIQLRVPNKFDPFSGAVASAGESISTLLTSVLLDLGRLGKGLCSLGVVSQTSKVLHALSREHLLLLNHIRDVLRRPFIRPSEEHSAFVTGGKQPPCRGSMLDIAVLASLRTSPGLCQLVPYLVYFTTCQIYQALAQSSPYLRPGAGIRVMLRTILALVYNTTIKTQLLVHQLLQAMQFVVLHPLLGVDSMPLAEASMLRYFAAQATARVVHHFAAADGGSITETVTGIYMNALCDIQQPLPTLLGAVIGVRCLGHHAVRSALLPAIPFFAKLLYLSYRPCGPPQLEDDASLDQVVLELKQDLVLELLGAITDGLAVKDTPWNLMSILSGRSPECSQAVIDAFSMLEELLGDGVVPLLAAGYRRDLSTEEGTEHLMV